MFMDKETFEKNDALINGQRVALELLASGKPLQDVLDVLIITMEQYLQNANCSILLCDKKENVLRLLSAPSMSKTMRNAMNSIVVGPLVGSCGAAAYHQTLVIVEDISTHPNWEHFKVIPIREGYRACWSKPIFSSKNELLGTFAVYYIEKKQPTIEELKELEVITNLVGITIERFELENELRSLKVDDEEFSLKNDFTLEKDFIRALEQNEFVLLYQPLYELSNQKVSAAESLIRWTHPEYGMISPADFIPLAEENDMIIPIGEQVLQMACKQKKEWDQKGYFPLSISINISPKQLEDPGFVEMVKRTLAKFNINPRHLSLEITENIFIQPEKIVVLKQLYDYGVRISLDDFGMGYSSLSYLKQLPIHRIKVDRSFIRNIPDSKEDSAITKAILDLCNTLSFEVVVEGVETKEQFEFLQCLQCDFIQGYYISKPLPPALFEEKFLT